MKKLLFVPFLALCFQVYGQDPLYYERCKQADSLFRAGNYPASAGMYTRAFETLEGRAMPEDRYEAAKAWGRSGNVDSTVFHLQRLMDKTDFLEEQELWMLDPAFDAFQDVLSWKRLNTKWQLKVARLEYIKTNPITLELEEIHRLDQYYRVKRDSVIELHGLNSPENRDWSKRWVRQDSLNYVRVNEILEKYGWLGTDEISEYAATALWLVIQHADRNRPAQEKWLPVMREAVRKGKAYAGNLAYLEDRVLKSQGKPQRYGSQLYTDPVSGELLLHPVEDPANLDARRKSMGLGSIQSYLEQTGAKWKQ